MGIPTYKTLMARPELLSHSNRKTLHGCGRRFELDKITAKEADETGNNYEDNVDFAFGHAVAAGVQYALLGATRDYCLLATFLAWDAEFDAERKKKTIWSAIDAVDKFIACKDVLFRDWELAYFTADGEPIPAIELSAMLDVENGYKLILHIDIVMKHKLDGRYMIVELKTTGFNNLHEAMYGNSEQALSYSIILDKIAHDLDAVASYTVLYLVYKVNVREWQPLPFVKNRLDRLAWIQDLQLDGITIDTYRNMGYFPKHGEYCYNFFRPCDYWGICGMSNDAFPHASVEDISLAMEYIPPELRFTLSDLIKLQTEGTSNV